MLDQNSLYSSRILAFLFILLVGSCKQTRHGDTSPLQFQVTYPAELGEEGFDGRLLLLISNNEEKEPGFQINDNNRTQLVFSLDVENWKPDEVMVVDGSVFGYPLSSFAGIPPGDYYVQALLHKFETFNLSNGHTVKLPMDQVEVQHHVFAQN